MNYIAGFDNVVNKKEYVVVQTIEDRYYTIEKDVFNFIQVLLADQLSPESYDANQMFIKKLCKYGLILENTNNSIRIPMKINDDIFYFHKEIFNGIGTEHLIKLLSKMFHPVFFVILVCLLLLIHISFFYSIDVTSNYIDFIDGDFTEIVSIIGFLGFSSYIHEVGHLAALYRFTKKVRPMGVGIFLIYPVFYSDVSPIYLCSSKEKAIIMVAGVVSQLLLTAIMLLFFGKIQIIQIFVMISFYMILYDLIPLYKSDGYWILNDYFGYQRPFLDVWDKIKNNTFNLLDIGVFLSVLLAVGMQVVITCTFLLYYNPILLIPIIENKDWYNNIYPLTITSLQYFAITALSIKFIISRYTKK